MNPILFILALVVGLAFLWLAFVFASFGDDWRENAYAWIPFGVIGVAVLTAAGLGMGGVI